MNDDGRLYFGETFNRAWSNFVYSIITQEDFCDNQVIYDNLRQTYNAELFLTYLEFKNPHDKIIFLFRWA